ncbi:hypothetical protein E5Q_00131 [Mixia osmundae IAM 14324]|uniref:RRM domain-containing protein n=1 Tax=Mixia osmundae (strain CBS 9802 / IAM 14324 / JCM 22182 / KY 12970) TaxID=764103 RepID=G7DSD1_MIXOS|nr:hypothetical protein E5Q_00131 [Mixia osmundae IAM 14324]
MAYRDDRYPPVTPGLRNGPSHAAGPGSGPPPLRSSNGPGYGPPPTPGRPPSRGPSSNDPYRSEGRPAPPALPGPRGPGSGGYPDYGRGPPMPYDDRMPYDDPRGPPTPQSMASRPPLGLSSNGYQSDYRDLPPRGPHGPVITPSRPGALHLSRDPYDTYPNDLGSAPLPPSYGPGQPYPHPGRGPPPPMSSYSSAYDAYDDRRGPLSATLSGDPYYSSAGPGGRSPPPRDYYYRDSPGSAYRDEQRPYPPRGPPLDPRDVPLDARGPPLESRGPPFDPRGPPLDTRGQMDSRGPRGPPLDTRPPLMDARGPPLESRGPPVESRGTPGESRGPPVHSRGPSLESRGPPDSRNSVDLRGPPSESRGPPGAIRGAPTAAREPRAPPLDSRDAPRPAADPRDARGPPADARDPRGTALDTREGRVPPPGDTRDARGPPMDTRDARGPTLDGREAPSDARDARALLPGSRPPRGPPLDARDPRGPPNDLRDSRGLSSDPRDPRGPPSDLRGPFGDARGPPLDMRGPPDHRGDDFRGPPVDMRGPIDSRSLPMDPRLPLYDQRGPSFDPRDQRPFDPRDFRDLPRGAPYDSRGIPFDSRDPRASPFDPRAPSFDPRAPYDSRGPPFDPRGVPFDARDPRYSPDFRREDRSMPPHLPDSRYDPYYDQPLSSAGYDSRDGRQPYSAGSRGTMPSYGPPDVRGRRSASPKLAPVTRSDRGERSERNDRDRDQQKARPPNSNVSARDTAAPSDAVLSNSTSSRAPPSTASASAPMGSAVVKTAQPGSAAAATSASPHPNIRSDTPASVAPNAGLSGTAQSAIFMGLPPDCDDVMLKRFLEQLGARPESTSVIKDKSTGLSKRYGFAKFVSIDDARTFVETHHPFVMWRDEYGVIASPPYQIKVDYSQTERTEPGQKRAHVVVRSFMQDQAAAQAAAAKGLPIRAASELIASGLKGDEKSPVLADSARKRSSNDGVRDIGTLPSSVLLIRNLDTTVTETALTEILDGMGDDGDFKGDNGVRKIMMVRDRRTKLSWGFAFVEYISVASASRAITTMLDPVRYSEGFVISGKPIGVTFAHQQSFHPTPMRSQYTFRGPSGGALKLYWDENAFCSDWEPEEVKRRRAEERAARVALIANGLPGAPGTAAAVTAVQSDASAAARNDSPGLTASEQASADRPLSEDEAARVAAAVKASETAKTAAIAALRGERPPQKLSVVTSAATIPPSKTSAPAVSAPSVAKVAEVSAPFNDATSGTAKVPSLTPTDATRLLASQTAANVAISSVAEPSPAAVVTANGHAGPVEPSQPQELKKTSVQTPVQASATPVPTVAVTTAPSPAVDLTDPTMAFADTEKMHCLLCQRQFKLLDDLKRHNTLSALHKTNLASPAIVAAGEARRAAFENRTKPKGALNESQGKKRSFQDGPAGEAKTDGPNKHTKA